MNYSHKTLREAVITKLQRVRQLQCARHSKHDRGFTLIELAVALVVVAMFLGSILVPLTTQVAQRKTSDTQKALEEIKEALAGFAIARGRLPCPASTTSNGVESPVGGGACTNPLNGFIPAATLGLASTDSQGYSIDGWGTRVRYAVTTSNGNAFTTANGMRTTTMGTLAPNLYVCATSTGTSATTCGTAQALVSGAPAVIYSLGPNGPSGCSTPPPCADEADNIDNDPVFVSHVRSDKNATNGEFDDIVTWLSANVLYSRMVSAGQLP